MAKNNLRDYIPASAEVIYEVKTSNYDVLVTESVVLSTNTNNALFMFAIDSLADMRVFYFYNSWRVLTGGELIVAEFEKEAQAKELFRVILSLIVGTEGSLKGSV